jgi:hypothetical protein
MLKVKWLVVDNGDIFERSLSALLMLEFPRVFQYTPKNRQTASFVGKDLDVLVRLRSACSGSAVEKEQTSDSLES